MPMTDPASPAAVTEERIEELRQSVAAAQKLSPSAAAMARPAADLLAAYDARGLELARRDEEVARLKGEVAQIRRDWIKNAEELRKFADEDAATAARLLAHEKNCYDTVRAEYSKCHERALAAETRLAQEFTRGAREGWMRAAVFYMDEEALMDAECDPQIIGEMDIRFPLEATPPAQSADTEIPEWFLPVTKRAIEKVRAQSAGEALDPAGAGEGDAWSSDGLTGEVKQAYDDLHGFLIGCPLSDERAHEIGNLIRAQASALAEARTFIASGLPFSHSDRPDDWRGLVEMMFKTADEANAFSEFVMKCRSLTEVNASGG